MSKTKEKYSRLGNEDLEEEMSYQPAESSRISRVRMLYLGMEADEEWPLGSSIDASNDFLVPTVSLAFHMTKKYGTYDEEGNRAWDELVPVKHGLFALADPYRYDLQPGHEDKNDENVAWFGVAVFHQLHCLRALRDTVRQLKTGQPARDWGGPDHLEHCLDYIRQGLMCSADTTIEWPVFVKNESGKDGPITGEGIEHQCRDWNAVRAFGMRSGELIDSLGKQ
ncbi:uncharacterized protein RCO7_10550 [Rhynchosporium graminicola]|uniref:Oxidase ustYa n=1 Tax=Rhynchosporium graminicola TaxID=2792576 RepID=A0A1E1K6E4_9HELO|nr:uncharacterized protein RCO7_10550 [Rhynchosporium commune]